MTSTTLCDVETPNMIGINAQENSKYAKYSLAFPRLNMESWSEIFYMMNKDHI